MTDGADPRAEQRVGSVLNEKWTLEHLIGAGGMGAVYSARHRNGARAAVKLLHPELARTTEIRERFLREGYAANRVDHRGAVQVLDDDIIKGGPDEGSAYLVMELLEGESLHERVLRAPKLAERELLEVMEAVLDVLAAAHEHGVIHRDLKPENIFLAHDPERDGVRVKVLDFGLARLAEAASVTSAGIAVGTPSFMSPEQAAGRSDEIDGRTDIFALGATIFRILTGRRIHDADNMVQLVVLMATTPAPRLRTIAPDVSESLARIVDHALAFERGDRYATASVMGADVHAAIEMTAARGSMASLHVIPFSTRAVRVADAVEVLGATSADFARPRAKTTPDADASPGAAIADSKEEWFEQEPQTASPASARGVGRSATLPWAIVLLLLALGAWKLGPSLQDELVRRASFEPVRAFWSPTSVSTTPPPASASTQPTNEVVAIDAGEISVTEAIDAGDFAAGDATDASLATSMLDAFDVDEDAGLAMAPQMAEPGRGALETAPSRDAGPSHTVAAQPRAPSHPQSKPPAKKIPAKKPTPQQRRR